MKLTALIMALVIAAGMACAAQFPKAEDVLAEFTQNAGKVSQEQKGGTTFYVARNATGVVTKVAYLKYARGYKGQIAIVAIVVKNGASLAFESVRLVEGKSKYKEATNGRDAAFMQQFAGKAADKDTQQLQLDAMTGATKTSRAIMRALDQERANLRALFGLK